MLTVEGIDFGFATTAPTETSVPMSMISTRESTSYEGEEGIGYGNYSFLNINVLFAGAAVDDEEVSNNPRDILDDLANWGTLKSDYGSAIQEEVINFSNLFSPFTSIMCNGISLPGFRLAKHVMDLRNRSKTLIKQYFNYFSKFFISKHICVAIIGPA